MASVPHEENIVQGEDHLGYLRWRLLGPPASGWREQGCLCVLGPVLFWMVVLLVVVLGSVSFLLCHRRACRKWIQQSEYIGLGAWGRAGALCWPSPGSVLPWGGAARGSAANSAVLSELYPCYPVQTFRPKLEPAGECPDVQRGLLGPQGHSGSGPWVWGSVSAQAYW